MKNILFPTDFSEAASQAFLYALYLADKWQARITTLHVYQPVDKAVATHLPITMQRIYDSIELAEFENYRDTIPHLRDIAESRGYRHVEVRHVMQEGDHVVPALLEGVVKEKADLVVMGTTGARGLREIFLGSVAGELLEKAPCPVLAVPEKSVFDGHLDRIAFTTSYKEEEKQALERVLDFAAPLGAEVHVINVDLEHTHFFHHRMDALREEYRDTGGLFFHVLEGGDLYKTITAFLDENRIDLLAMVTHRRGFLRELFNYSKAKMMSYHALTPVLSLPVREKD